MTVKHPNGTTVRVSSFKDKDEAALALEEVPSQVVDLMEAVDEERWEDARSLFDGVAGTLNDLNIFIKSKEDQ
jgi:hypothetical protein